MRKLKLSLNRKLTFIDITIFKKSATMKVIRNFIQNSTKDYTWKL